MANKRACVSKLESQMMSLSGDLQQARVQSATEKDLLESVKTALRLKTRRLNKVFRNMLMNVRGWLLISLPLMRSFGSTELTWIQSLVDYRRL